MVRELGNRKGVRGFAVSGALKGKKKKINERCAERSVQPWGGGGKKAIFKPKWSKGGRYSGVRKKAPKKSSSKSTSSVQKLLTKIRRKRGV